MRLFLPSSVLILVLHSFLSIGQTKITLDGRSPGRTFEGIVGVSGGGATSRLLISYPEPQRSQIFDLLFKPGFGASLHGLKVEIGGDGNSTEGSEASHSHFPGDRNFHRGYEWEIMKEARKRNPDILLYALAWDYPGWLKSVDSDSTVVYLVDWLKAARDVHGLTVDYIGIWNETKTRNSFIKKLFKGIRKAGLKTRIAADDQVNNWSIADSLVVDKELAEAIAVVGTHYPGFKSTETAKRCGKPLHSLEDGPWTETWGANGPVGMGYSRSMTRNYIEGKMVSTHLWNMCVSYYETLDFPEAGLMRAQQPWSGYYQIGSPLWIAAHVTQFVKPGWQYLDRSCGYLQNGGSFITLKKGADFSTVIETMDASREETLEFKISGDIRAEKVFLWKSDKDKQFVRLEPIPVQNGKFSVRLLPGCMYTLTSTQGQQKGGFGLVPPKKNFPFPYKEDFENYKEGFTNVPHFIEQNGCYEINRSAEGGKYWKQVVNQAPLSWTYGQSTAGLGTACVIGDENWGDYSVSARMRMAEPGYMQLWGRVSRVDRGRGTFAGYAFIQNSSGVWYLKDGIEGRKISMGFRQILLNTDYVLKMRFHKDTIQLFMDETLLGTILDSTHRYGQVGVGFGWNQGRLDDLRIDESLPGLSPLLSESEREGFQSQHPPEAPELARPVSLPGALKITWNRVKGASSYKLLFGEESGKYHSSIPIGNATETVQSTLTPGKRYYFKIVAGNRVGESTSEEKSGIAGEQK